MSDVALANEPEARTETGEIKDQTPSTTSIPSPETKTETKSAEAKSTDKPSLVNAKEPEKAESKAADGAPEKYEAFKLPEGFEMPEDNLKEVQGAFKELNLSQDSGQKLVDLYHKFNQQAAEAPFKLWQETQEKWQNEVKSDPEIGSKLSEVKTTVAKAIDGLGKPELANQFREAMDYTGAGNNLAFIKTFWLLAQKVTEGGHVSGTGPSKFGQAAPGTPDKPTAARAMYPNLP